MILTSKTYYCPSRKVITYNLRFTKYDRKITEYTQKQKQKSKNQKRRALKKLTLKFLDIIIFSVLKIKGNYKMVCVLQ